jgi:hypothetical protein
MNQIHDRPLAGTCAKGTLWGLTRTGGLVVGAVLASILLVDLPIPGGRGAEAPPYVPAAETWIEPKAASPAEATVKSEAVDRGEESGPRPDLTAAKERPSRDKRGG